MKVTDYHISEVNSTGVLGFTFDYALTWHNHIEETLTRGKQRLNSYNDY